MTRLILIAALALAGCDYCSDYYPNGALIYLYSDFSRTEAGACNSFRQVTLRHFDTGMIRISGVTTDGAPMDFTIEARKIRHVYAKGKGEK